jgi:hypothetical protein
VLEKRKDLVPDPDWQNKDPDPFQMLESGILLIRKVSRELLEPFFRHCWIGTGLVRYCTVLAGGRFFFY